MYSPTLFPILYMQLYSEFYVYITIVCTFVFVVFCGYSSSSNFMLLYLLI